MKQLRRQMAAGFTLVEMLLALGILGLILAMLAGSFNVVAHGKTHAEARLEANQAGSAIIWQMSDEIRSAARAVPIPGMTAPPTLRTLFVGTGHTAGGTPIDSFQLSTFGAGHRRSLFGFAPEDIVTYGSQPNPGHRGWFLLMRSQQSGLLPAQAGGPQVQSLVLADNLLALHLRYFNGQIWNESWDSQVQGEMPLPVSVRIELSIASPSGGPPLNFSTEVAVPMAGGTNLPR